MREALLDTDILSEVMRGKNEVVRGHARKYQQEFGSLTISAVTVVEIVKGFERLHRDLDIQRFLNAINTATVLPLGMAEAELAGRIYGALEHGGRPIGRADPMIAATAILHGRVLVTGNESHYQFVRDVGFALEIENWRNEHWVQT